MKLRNKILLMALVFALSLVFEGCGRGTIRTRTHNPSDRSVTLIKRPKRKRFKGRKKAVKSKKYNRAPSKYN